MVSTHNKEGGRNKVRVERGKGGKRKKRKRREGRRKLGGAVMGALAHIYHP